METESTRGKVLRMLAIIIRYTLVTLKWVVIAGIVLGCLAGGAAFGYVSALVREDPVRPKETMTAQVQQNAMTGFVYFNDESVLGQLRAEEDRRMAKLEDIPQQVLDAVFAIEDNRFYEHHGVDVKGLARAVYQKLMRQEIQTGGSTITQQLARRVFLTLDKQDSRKAKEIFLSMRMERLMSKDEILLAYLNKIPYGNGSAGYNLYGIKAAAKGIFDISDLNQLNIAQSAYLAGLPQQPSNYSTFDSKGHFDGAAFKRAVERQQLVLRRMLEEGKIDQQQYQEALNFDLRGSLAKPVEKAYSVYPYLMIEVEKEAAKALLAAENPTLTPESNPEAYSAALKSAQRHLSRGGYHVHTTIDKDIYKLMRDIAKNPGNFSPDDPVKGMEQAGAVMIDNKTGAILGLMEGRDFFKEQLNHATQAYRQPGSTMKVIAAYLPAIEKGAIQPASIIDDVPVILKNGANGYHIPENWNNKFHGLVTARKALNQSYNIPAIKLFLDVVGIEQAWDLAKKLGISSITPDDYYAQTGVIGGLKYGTSVKELTNAYAAIGNKGAFNRAHMISRITDSNGKTIYAHEPKPAQVFSEETAYIMTDMMRTVVTAGTAVDLMGKFKHYGKIPTVGKTGSTQDDADAWYMGYTPDITLGVWAGYDSPVHKLSKTTGGTNRAKNIWALVMDGAIDKKPNYFKTTEFARPENIVEMTVSGYSGKLPSEATTKSGRLNTDIFNKKYIPTEEYDVFTRLSLIRYNNINYIAQPSTPAEFVTTKTVIKREKSINDLLNELSSIMNKVPEDRRRSIESYRPLDYDDDAPSAVDPRVDDEKAPDAPTTVVATHSGDTSVITFQASSSPDTVGYRLYRSINRGEFARVNGNVVHAGAATRFTDKTSRKGVIGYYVTAVDVAGKESEPSKASFTDGTRLDLISSHDSGADNIRADEQFSRDDAADGGESTALPGANGSTNLMDEDTAGHNSGGGDDKEDLSSSPVEATAPSNVQLKRSGAGLIVSWKSNPTREKVDKYVIYFSEREKGSYKKLGTVSSGTEFRYYAANYAGYYKVAAVNQQGESEASAPIRNKK
ncbi:transglycosylase domain-containing protein [Paenibacillus xerothermodurans]|uniref:Penicillin-binding protein n=1 Tax=Paenibacillus xerothermodurans TaxID=1977292 RepID=A0A2W1NVD8_PAEXE|nr:transglycosylase domain-containing protein [Paenibacillus xerothermodurans]PZE22553.1 penicillin-binding protein [Paenibacillus xerothermodurans]